MELFHKIIATGFGAGFAPKGPGTFGTAVAFLISFLLHWTFPHALANWESSWSFPLFVIAVTLLGVWSSYFMENIWGKDAQRIVIDEMAGFWVTMILVPWSLSNAILAFVLFRLFDITKPLGIKKMESIGQGWGVMMDDVLAGVYANLVLQLILLSPWF